VLIPHGDDIEKRMAEFAIFSAQKLRPFPQMATKRQSARQRIRRWP
jgi:hypothetical protein